MNEKETNKITEQPEIVEVVTVEPQSETAEDNTTETTTEKEVVSDSVAQQDTEQQSTQDADNTTKNGKHKRKISLIPNEEEVETAIKTFSERELPQPKKRKNRWLGTVLLLAVIGLGLYFMIKLASTVGEGEIQSLDKLIENINWVYAGVALGILVISIFADALKYSVVTRATEGKSNFRTSCKVALLGKYYDNITPFTSGGQPMQIYYLHKKGYSTGSASAVILIKYFANMFAWVTICFCLMAFNGNALNIYVTDNATRQVFLIAGWIGWAVNAIMPVLIVVFAFFPKVTGKVLGGLVSLMHKMRIVKDKERAMKRVYNGVNDFRASFVIMSKKPLRFLMLLLLCVFEPFITMSFPYFALVALGGDAVTPGISTMFAVMTLNVFATMSVAVIPTPGNSGFVENAVLLAFQNIAASVLFWVVFVWRFCTYYIYILIGLILNIFEVIRGAVRSRREKKQSAEPPTD